MRHPLFDQLTVRELTPNLVQEYIDLAGDEAREQAEKCALVEIITRMTAVGMSASEIARHLDGVQAGPIRLAPDRRNTVLYMRQLATGSKGSLRVPLQRWRSEDRDAG